MEAGVWINTIAATADKILGSDAVHMFVQPSFLKMLGRCLCSVDAINKGTKTINLLLNQLEREFLSVL